ncbi:hypothetical protein FKM82_007097 [Ascaphus truei]
MGVKTCLAPICGSGRLMASFTNQPKKHKPLKCTAIGGTKRVAVVSECKNKGLWEITYPLGASIGCVSFSTGSFRWLVFLSTGNICNL